MAPRQILICHSVLSPVSPLYYKGLGKAHTPIVLRIQRLPCAKGAVALATEGLFLLNFFILQSLRQPSAATSLVHAQGRLLRYHNYITNRQRKQVLCRYFVPVISSLRMHREYRPFLFIRPYPSASSPPPPRGRGSPRRSCPRRGRPCASAPGSEGPRGPSAEPRPHSQSPARRRRE